MSVREQLDWEARWAKPAATSAFVSALSLIASTVVRQAALDGAAEDDRKVLIAVHDHQGAFLASTALQVLSLLALTGVLYYLGRAVLARNPGLPKSLIWLGVIGPPLLAIAAVFSDLHRVDLADQFLLLGGGTVEQAENLLEDRNVLATSVGSAGTLALAIAFVFFNVNALRVGLLTRFVGVIGAIVGVLYVIPLLAGPVIQLLWLLAVGALFLGYWPGGGRGPAWETGEAIEWPSGRVRGPVADGPTGVPDVQTMPVNGNGSDGDGRSRSPRKRKKKRR